MRIGLTVVILLAWLGACTPRPAFIPAPQKVFNHFRALPMPGWELAVGALWIDGHGPYGPGAGLDNLETLPGIGAVVIDSDIQASLSLGFLQYLDLDPTLRSKIAVRLNEVTLVRVKDLARLDGPSEQPRIYEALRAGTATITTTRDIGLSIEARAAQQGMAIAGRGTTGRLSTFTIEAKDVFLAVHVATLRATFSKPHEVVLTQQPGSVELEGFTVKLSKSAPEGCQQATLTIRKGTGVVLGPTSIDLQESVDLKLEAPVSKGRSLFDHLMVNANEGTKPRCSVTVMLRGTSLVSENP